MIVKVMEWYPPVGFFIAILAVLGVLVPRLGRGISLTEEKKQSGRVGHPFAFLLFTCPQNRIIPLRHVNAE